MCTRDVEVLGRIWLQLVNINKNQFWRIQKCSNSDSTSLCIFSPVAEMTSFTFSSCAVISKTQN